MLSSTDDDDDASAAFATDIPNGPATTRAFLDLVAGGFLAARVLPSQGGGGAGRVAAGLKIESEKELILPKRPPLLLAALLEEERKIMCGKC